MPCGPSFWIDGSGWKMEAEGQTDMKVEIVIKIRSGLIIEI